LVHEGDVVILITYATMTMAQATDFNPKVIHVDQYNRMIQIGSDPAEAITPGLTRPPFAMNKSSKCRSKPTLTTSGRDLFWAEDISVAVKRFWLTRINSSQTN